MHLVGQGNGRATACRFLARCRFAGGLERDEDVLEVPPPEFFGNGIGPLEVAEQAELRIVEGGREILHCQPHELSSILGLVLDGLADGEARLQAQQREHGFLIIQLRSINRGLGSIQLGA